MVEPRISEDLDDRRTARRVRDAQWELLEDLRDNGPLRIFVMLKRPVEGRERNYCWASSNEELPWVLDKKKGWVTVEDQNLVTITPAGIAALEDRAPYDNDSIIMGFVEPGRSVVPLPREEMPDA
jgi:hypothetical protein